MMTHKWPGMDLTSVLRHRSLTGMAAGDIAGANLVVVVIDIGETHSRCLCSKPTDRYRVSGLNSYPHRHAEESYTEPSCILLNPQKEFVACGYDAEFKYIQLAKKDKHRDWYYFPKFKMEFYENKFLDKDCVIEDISGKKLKALEIFAHAIRFMKDHVIHLIQRNASGLLEKDISFVLTVPANYIEFSKQFMKQAAIKAGIPNHQIKLVLTPEAASVFCQERPDRTYLNISAVGEKYMIVNLDGGHSEVTVHEIHPHYTSIELHEAAVDICIWAEVEKLFLQLVGDIVGIEDWLEYGKDNHEDMLAIRREFEYKQRFALRTGNNFFMELPVSLVDILHNQTGKSLDERFDNKIKLIQRSKRIRIHKSIFLNIYDAPVNGIISHVKEILSMGNMQNINNVILVGDYAGIRHVQEMFKTMILGKRVIIPRGECGIVILIGAAILGRSPNSVTFRIEECTHL